MSVVSDLVANRFARVVRASSKGRLERAMRGPQRRVILTQIFRAMPRQYRREAAGDVEAVVHWEIGGGRNGAADRYEMVLADGRCRTSRRPRREPNLTIR